jgi:hypothetical protein
MNPISVAISTYLLTIIFALLIALVIAGLGVFIKKLGLGRNDEGVEVTIPTSNSLKEEEALAVAIAVARAQRK